MNATGTIRIVSIPDGEGYLSETCALANRRSSFVGCELPLADPTTIRRLEAEFFSDVEIEPVPAYAVAFEDVIAALRAVGRYDSADYYANLAHRPVLVRFPRDCAELITA